MTSLLTRAILTNPVENVASVARSAQTVVAGWYNRDFAGCGQDCHLQDTDTVLEHSQLHIIIVVEGMSSAVEAAKKYDRGYSSLSVG